MPERFGGMHPDARRLLGLDRNLAPLESDKKKEFLRSENRIRTYDRIDTNTNPRRAKAEQKKGIVSELLEKKYLNVDTLKNYPTVYLGSGVDIEYPLSIGAREIILVDPGFSNDEWRNEIKRRLEDIVGQVEVVGDGELSCDFDFGDGAEKVRVKLVPKMFEPPSPEHAVKYGKYEFPELVGGVVTFASQGPMGRVGMGDNIKSHLIPKGFILNDTDLYERDSESGEWNKIELGK